MKFSPSSFDKDRSYLTIGRLCGGIVGFRASAVKSRCETVRRTRPNLAGGDAGWFGPRPGRRANRMVLEAQSNMVIRPRRNGCVGFAAKQFHNYLLSDHGFDWSHGRTRRCREAVPARYGNSEPSVESRRNSLMSCRLLLARAAEKLRQMRHDRLQGTGWRRFVKQSFKSGRHG